MNLETRTPQGKERSCLEIADAEVQVIDLGGLKNLFGNYRYLSFD